MTAPGTILVANIGSTSFKFRLYQMPDEVLLARGGVERIGSPASPWTLQAGDAPAVKGETPFRDTAEALAFVGAELEKRFGHSLGSVSAFGFKPVMARGISGTQVLDESVLGAMEALTTLFPAHNPPYVRAVRILRGMFPDIPCIGTFETAFYDHMPVEATRYPIPLAWEKEHGIRRYGFHGASHRFVNERAAQLRGSARGRFVSCHLGGSSSLAAVRDGRAIDSSWGMTPQSGLPQNNRVGDFDVFAALYAVRDLGLGVDAVEKILGSESGLKGMSGLPSGDIRDLKDAAASGNEDARIALEVFTRAIRRYLGQFVLEMNGLDLLIFTAGIGENNPDLRAAVCRDLDYLGLRLDPAANAAALGREALISTPDSRVEVRVIPTNEELVIARNAWTKLQEHPAPSLSTQTTAAPAAVH
jgi:acetate kinase